MEILNAMTATKAIGSTIAQKRTGYREFLLRKKGGKYT
jgi:hypothetical protein